MALRIILMLNITLYQPEIPFNTANIIRTCVALNAKLHIIGPYGFDLSRDHPDLKRGSTNYLEDVDLTEYSSFDEFVKINDITNKNFAILSRYGENVYSDIDVSPVDDMFVMFGKESTGIPINILKDHADIAFRIPMDKKMRSLNLSNCVALVGYDIMRKLDFPGLSFEEVQKKDFLK